MQKNYNLVKVSVLLLLLLLKNNLQAQNRCLDCPADVKVVTDKQVLLDKIEIQDGVSTKINTNLYVSYRSGNAQKFWANLAIATAGVAVSTQLQSNSSVEGNNAHGISPLIPLGVSVATLPSIWKNRPRGVPQAGLWLQHRDTRGRLTDTWEQPISSEAKNSGELLSINIDKPLSTGTVEVYLQNGSKNPVYYWGLQTVKSAISNKLLPPKTPPIANSGGCPDGYLSNGNGMCCNFFNGECIDEPTGGGDGNPTPPPPPTPQGCPSGYLPNGQGMCCNPVTSHCVSEGSGTNQTNSTNSTCYLDIYQMSDAPVSTTSMVTGAMGEREQMESQGWELVRSIAFNCNTGLVQPAEGFPAETNVNNAASQAMNDYIAQHQNNNNNGGGGTGGGYTGGPASCPSGYLPNGQGMCCSPFTGQCVSPGGGGPTGDSNCIDGVDLNGNPCYNGGGGGDNTDPTRIQTDKVKTLCTKAALDKVTNLINNSSGLGNDFLEQLKREIIDNPNGKNIVFDEAPSVTSKTNKLDAAGNKMRDQNGNYIFVDVEVSAQTRYNPQVDPSTITIAFNSSMLPGTDTKFQEFTVLHEYMHALLVANGSNASHQQMLVEPNLGTLRNAVQSVLGIGEREALTLCLYGCYNAKDSNSYEAAISNFNIDNPNSPLSRQDIVNIGASYSNAQVGSDGKEVSGTTGGKDCL